jgi:hypothetical protein
MIRQGCGGDLESGGVEKRTSVDKKGSERVDYIFPEEMISQELETIIANQKRSLDA